MAMTAAQLKQLTVDVAEAMRTSERMTGTCCARVYVQPVSKLLANSKAFYIGYDNATGVEGGRGEAVAKVLKAAGIDCYMDADMD